MSLTIIPSSHLLSWYFVYVSLYLLLINVFLADNNTNTTHHTDNVCKQRHHLQNSNVCLSSVLSNAPTHTCYHVGAAQYNHNLMQMHRSWWLSALLKGNPTNSGNKCLHLYPLSIDFCA